MCDVRLQKHSSRENRTPTRQFRGCFFCPSSAMTQSVRKEHENELYFLKEAARRDRWDLVPVSPGFKLILVRPVERSVATGFPCEHGQESCVLYAPLATFSS